MCIRQHLFYSNKQLSQPILGPDGKKKEPESNVLLASIENMQYAVTVDVLHTVKPSVIISRYSSTSLGGPTTSVMVLVRYFRCSQHLVLSRRLQSLRKMVDYRH